MCISCHSDCVIQESHSIDSIKTKERKEKMTACKAYLMQNKHGKDFISMFKESLKYRDKLITKDSKLTSYYCVIFDDNSRLTFYKHDKEFRLMSWFYYI